MVLWYLVWIELLMLSILITILIIPMPLVIKTLIAKGLNAMWHNFYVRAAFAANMCILLFQFGDAYNEMLKYQANKDALGQGVQTGAGSLGEKIDLNMKLFRAQRNVYLAFFSLFEWFVLFGFIKYVRELQALRGSTSLKVVPTKGAPDSPKLSSPKDTVKAK
jgi:hypothetical protein